MNKKQRRWRNRIVIALALFAAALAVEQSGLLATLFGTPGDVYASFALFLVPYLIAGYKTLLEAARNIRRGEAFDEAFLMSVASLGAFAPTWPRAPRSCSSTRWVSSSRATPWARAASPSRP